jgi:hypothetical protein
MKPIASKTSNSTHRDAFDRVIPYDRPAPITDYNYHSITFEGAGARYVRNPPRSFWSIAGDYFKNEARRDFRSEAALFAIITITAALALINNMHALIEFARAITSQ